MLGPVIETLIGGLLTGVLYSLVALGFVVATAAIALLVNGVEKERAQVVAPAE